MPASALPPSRYAHAAHCTISFHSSRVCGLSARSLRTRTRAAASSSSVRAQPQSHTFAYHQDTLVTNGLSVCLSVFLVSQTPGAWSAQVRCGIHCPSLYSHLLTLTLMSLDRLLGAHGRAARDWARAAAACSGRRRAPPHAQLPGKSDRVSNMHTPCPQHVAGWIFLDIWELNSTFAPHAT